MERQIGEVRKHQIEDMSYINNEPSSSFQIYGTTQKQYQPSFVITSPPQQHYTYGNNVNYSPMNSQMLSGPPIIHPPPHMAQGSVPIVTTRPLIQGHPITGQTLGNNTTIIHAPTPIIKPVVYQTIQSPQQTETIQQLMSQYRLLYDRYKQLQNQREGGQFSHPESRIITTKRKKSTLQRIFVDTQQEIQKSLNRIFQQRVRQGESAIEKITNDGLRQIDNIRFY